MKLCFTSLHPAFFELLESRFERLNTAFVTVNHDSVLLIPIEPVGLFAKIKALGVLPAHLPLVLDAGTVLVSVPPFSCEGFVCCHCTRGRALLDNTHGKDRGAFR